MRIAIIVIALLAALSLCSLLVAQNAGKYAGIDRCKMCHPDIHADWSKSAHARAFELLENVDQQKNPECLGCHTTGFQKDGFVDEASTPGLKAVVCEACHGPGAEHADSMDKTKIQRKPGTDTCSSCHQKNNIHSLKE